MTNPIKIGIVGLGRAAMGMHVEELKGREHQYRIAAACDIIPERRQVMADTYGCKTYERIEDLVADPEIELVDIVSGSRDHYPHAILALAAGKHVFLEKPMTLTYQEALLLQEAEAKSSGKLFMRHNRRFDPDFTHVRKIIASGILGDVFLIKLSRNNFEHRDDWQTLKEFGGGMLLNWGPHIIDHALQYLESPVKSMFSDLKRIASAGDAEDHIKILLKGENGRVVDMEISGGTAIGSPAYLVHGSRGSLSLSLTDWVINLKYLDPKIDLMNRTANSATPGVNNAEREALVWVEESMLVEGTANTVIWDEVHDAIRLGTSYPISIDEAVEVMRIISAVKENTPFQYE